MIPKNVQYKFEADEAENLDSPARGRRRAERKRSCRRVAVRDPKDVQRQTSFADGAIKVGNDKQNGESSKRRVVAKGKYFSPD